MLESALARLLHHHLGKYILDFDADNLNVGIFSGDIRLTDLILKPEALYELNLPIAVKYGKVESILISIPWSFLKSKAVQVTVQGIWLIAEPCLQNGDEIREKRLIRATKQHLLNECMSMDGSVGDDSSTNHHKQQQSTAIINQITSFFTNNIFTQILTAIQYNLQITINDIHLRYEDEVSTAALGLCIQSISLQTTDKKWKQLNEINQNSTHTFQILKMESISTYWDTTWNQNQTKHNHNQNDLYLIRNELANGLKTFQMYDKPFDFSIVSILIDTTYRIKAITQ